MALQQLFTSRKPYTATTFVAGLGKMFYDETSGALRIGDGETPGGSLISYPLASSTQIGGVKLGPGVVLNGAGQIIIDSEGLDFSFGDLASTTETYTDNSDYAVLQTINLNEDLILASNGLGGIHVVGEFRVHATNGALTETLESTPVFEIKADGQVKILVPTIDSTEGAVSIVGSSTGTFISPVNTGVMLHVTGQYGTPAIPSRIYNDSQNTFAAFVARRFNGTVNSPTAVLADEEIMRISGTSHNGTTIPGTGQARIVYKALGNQTLSNQGGYIELWTTPLNSTTIAKVATINSTGITLNSGTVVGNLTGTADTATTVTLTATNGTTATHYIPFVSTSTGNQSVRTDTDLSYNPGTNTLFVPRLQSKLYRYSRDAGIIGAGGTLTIDFSVDDVVYCTWGDGMTLAYQNYTAGSVVRLMATKTSGGNDPINLDGVTAANVSNGATVTNNYSQGSTAFIEFTCVNTTIGSVYVKL